MSFHTTQPWRASLSLRVSSPKLHMASLRRPASFKKNAAPGGEGKRQTISGKIQAHLVEAQSDLSKMQQISCQVGYTSGDKNLVGIQDAFTSMV